MVSDLENLSRKPDACLELLMLPGFVLCDFTDCGRFGGYDANVFAI